MLDRFLQVMRRLKLKLARIRMAPGSKLGPNIHATRGIRNSLPGVISLGRETCIEAGVSLNAWGGSIHLADRVFLGPYTVIYGQGGVEVGEDCLIGMHCRILSSEHALPPLDRHIRWEPDVLKPTRLGRDVWLGAGVTVLGGVTLGDGCVVGAGAVVTRDIPPGSIALGVPARVVGSRPPAR
jgi:acetyltransferase-like isoleucine patch superfamily enzyme